MKKVKGDLIKLAKSGYFDLIVQGCNCFCTMNSGIAKTIKAEFPEAFEVDQYTKKGDKEKLGSYSFVEILIDDKKLIVVNAYTQFNYGKSGIYVSYDALREVFKKIKKNFSGKKIGYPAIGAGLAGGNWEKIYSIICEELNNEDHTFVEYVNEKEEEVNE
jgi:O-acetyl-ADP-ribose deacetylase (regulator of RNase III)